MYRQNISYQLIIRKQAVRVLLDMPARYASRIREQLDRLAENPDRRDITFEPLPDKRGFRLLTADHRIIIDRVDEARVLEILRIGVRPAAYK